MNRKLVAGALLAVLVLSSGCLGFLLGDTYSVSASKATVGDDTLSQTGYDQAKVKKVGIKRTFEAAGQSRDVKVTNWVAQYQKSISIAGIGEQPIAKFTVVSSPSVSVGKKSFNPLAKFTVVSSPSVSVGKKSFNPLAKFDNKDLVEKFVAGYANVNDVKTVGSKNVTMLGKETKVTEFTGTAKTHGVSIDVTIQATKVKHDGDWIVVLAVYPKKLDESDDVSQLISGVQHDG